MYVHIRASGTSRHNGDEAGEDGDRWGGTRGVRWARVDDIVGEHG